MKIVLIIRSVLFSSFLASLPAWSMEYASSFFATQGSVRRTIVSSLAAQVLPPIQSGDVINTKSQRPVLPKPQNYYEVSIQGRPIRENHRENKEIILKKTVPGEDGRIQVLQTDVWPHSVHGMVHSTFRADSGHGSGTLIAPNLVLTAAHNLYDRNLENGRRVGRARQVRFFPAINGKEVPFREQSVKAFYFPEDYESGANEDYGLLVLENPVGEMTGYFGVGILPLGQITAFDINVTGYPGDKVANKEHCHEMWGMKGKAKEVNQDFISYEIDTYAGQSGSGVWYQDGEDYFVIGVHVLGDEVLGVNKATLLTKPRYEKIRTWIKDSIQRGIITNIQEGMFKGAEYVDLSSKYIGDFGVRQLHQYNLRYLHTANLSTNSIGDEGCEVLAQHPTIIKLNVSNNSIGSRGARALAQNNIISELDVSWNWIDNEGSIALTQCRALTELNLSYNKISNPMSVILALAQNTRLRTLCFSNPYVLSYSGKALRVGVLGTGVVVGVAGGVGVAGAAAVVGSAGTALGVTGGVGIAVGSAVSKTINSLNGVMLGDEEAQALSNNTTLTKLNLKCNEIGDTGARALSNNTTLTELNLENNYIGGEAMALIEAMLERNNRI